MKTLPNKQKIIKAAEALRIILICSLLYWAFVFGACLMPWFVVVPHMERLWPLQAYVFSGVVLQPLLGMMATIYGIFFFDRLKSGFLFDAKTVGYLSATGKWWFGYWLYQTVFLGGRTLFFNIAMNWDPTCLIGALTIIIIAWFFREAQNLQEEQELTV
jgi:hypothetical protein